MVSPRLFGAAKQAELQTRILLSRWFSLTQHDKLTSSCNISYIYIYLCVCMYKYIYIYITIRLLNIAMENGSFIDDFPMKTSIYSGFSMAMLNNHRVKYLSKSAKYWKSQGGMGLPFFFCSTYVLRVLRMVLATKNNWEELHSMTAQGQLQQDVRPTHRQRPAQVC